jgi:hypothetical protein
LGNAFVGGLEQEGDDDRREQNEQEDKDDDGLAEADDAPVVEEMEFGFGRRGRCGRVIERCKKNGASARAASPKVKLGC